MRTAGKLLVFIACILLSGKVWSQQIEKNYQLGLDRYRVNYYEEALNFFKKAQNKDRSNDNIYFYLGHCQMFLGRMSEAEKSFKKAIRLAPQNAIHYNSIGYFYNQVNQYERALEMLSFAIMLDPSYAEAYNNRGISYYRTSFYSDPEQQDFTKAFEDFDKAIELDSTFAMAYNNRGTARYFNQHIAEPTERDVQLAIEDFDRALKYNPFLSTVYRNKAMAYNYLEQYDESIKLIQMAIYYAPNDPINYLNKARIMLSNDKPYDAIDNYKMALRKDSTIADAYFELGDVYSSIKLYDKAVESHLQAIGIDDYYQGAAFYNVSRTYAMQDGLFNTVFYLNLARKHKYFNKKTYLQFLKAGEFEPFRKEESFQKVAKKITRKVFR